jgi:hypothetical protein
MEGVLQVIRVPDDCEGRDVIRWLTSVFVAGPDKVPYTLLSADAHTVIGSRLDSPGRSEHLTPQDCYAHWPALGAFNLRNDPRSAVYISRSTVRQWNRSMCADLLQVRRLDGLVGRDWMRPGDYLHVPYLHAPFVSAAAACERVRTGGADSVAVTRRLAVGAGLCTYKVNLFVDGVLAGTVCDREVTVFPNADLNVVVKNFGEGYAVRQLAS